MNDLDGLSRMSIIQLIEFGGRKLSAVGHFKEAILKHPGQIPVKKKTYQTRKDSDIHSFPASFVCKPLEEIFQ